MKKLFLTLFLAAGTLFAHAQYPYEQNLVDQGTITFPDRPKEETQSSSTYYTLDAGPYYYVSQIDLIGIENNEGPQKANRLYHEFLRDALKDKSAKQIYEKRIHSHQMDGMETMIKGLWKGQMIYRYYQAYYYNGNFLVNGVWSVDSVSVKTPAIANYLSSFKPTVAQPEKQTDDEMPEKIGKIIGIALVLGALFFFITLVGFLIWLLIRWVKRSKRTESID